MKPIKYTLPLVASLALIGCGGDNNESSTTTTNTVDKTVTQPSKPTKPQPYQSPLPDTAPTYNVAMFEYTPFKFKDEYGNDVGYDVDLLRAIGEEAGFKVTMTEVPFSELLTSVQDGSYDLAMSGLSMIPERQALMLYSKPYSKGKPGYLVKSEQNYTEAQSLADKKISVLENSSLHGILKKQGSENLKLTPTMFLAFQSIFTSKSDAAFGMQPTLFYQSGQFAEHPVRFIPFDEPILTTIYAGKDKQPMIDKVNEGLDKIIANGKYHKINEHWFGDKASEIEIN